MFFLGISLKLSTKISIRQSETLADAMRDV